MIIQTRPTILKIAKHLFAVHGYEGFSMRTLAKESGVGLSSIYHFFTDKDEILKEIFDSTNIQLGLARKKLSLRDSASKMLKDRIMYQFEHIEDVVFVLKYYLHFRPKYLKIDSGYLPSKGYLHIEEVLTFGVENGELSITKKDISKQAKVIAHSINGFLLEYYPAPPSKKELQDVVTTLHIFMMRSLTNKDMIQIL